MKRFVIIIAVLIFPTAAFCRQMTEFHAADFIAICAFGYYQEHGTMPENISNLLEKEYFENTLGNLKSFSECGFEIILRKRNDRMLDIYVSSKRMQYHVVYKVEILHHFFEYLNGKFITDYYRDDTGAICPFPHPVFSSVGLGNAL